MDGFDLRAAERDLSPEDFKAKRAKALEEGKVKRASALQAHIAKMSSTYFTAEYRAQWAKNTITVELLDDTLATFRKKLTRTIFELIHIATDEILENALLVHRDRITALEKQLAEVKANPPTLIDSYQGIWQPGGCKRGDVVTLDGSLWLAMSDTDAKPGVGDTFKLIVKRGKDGKDLRP